MDSVCLISPAPFDLAAFARRLSKHFAVEFDAGGGLRVAGLGGRNYQNCDSHEPDPSLYCLVIDHSGGLQLIRKVIELIADDPLLTVDNGFETILPGNEYVARLQANPDWDWRREWLNRHDRRPRV